MTTVEARIKALRDCIRMIGPDKVQVNTVVRPPGEAYAMPVPRGQLQEIAAQLYPGAESIPPCVHVGDTDSYDAGCDDILDLLGRRPCSIADIATGLRLHPHEAAKSVELLLSEQKVRVKEQEGMLYYEAIP